MIVQVQDIIKDALGLIGAIAIDETPTNSEFTQALRTLNIMIDRWSSQRLMLRSSSPLTFPLVAGKSSYTVGTTGADVTAAKPITITSATYTDSNSNDYPVDIIDIVTYNNLGDKTISSGPVMYIAYDPGNTQQNTNKGTIYVYLTPDQAYTLSMEVQSYLTEFTSITDTVTFEPAYYEALVYNLAVRLFRYYRDAAAQIPSDILVISVNSLNNIKTMNNIQVICAMDLPGKTSSYNIYNDKG